MNNFYPAWKKASIEGGRVFVGAFVAQAVLLFSVDEVRQSLIIGANTVFKCLLPFDQICFFGASIWTESWGLLVIPAGAAGIKGLIKYLREKYAVNRMGATDYDHWLFKVPV